MTPGFIAGRGGHVWAMKRILATLAVLGILTGSACSASGSVDPSGDGVNIDADVDDK